MMCSYSALALVALSLGSGPHEAQADTDWCSLNCGRYENTMCQYEPQTETSTCSNIVSRMDNTKRKALLDIHNEYRNRIASGDVDGWPSASNMRQMSWDYDLEQVAERWAQQCIWGHDQCRRTPMFQRVGQNMASGTSWKEYRPTDFFSGWIKEISETSPSIVSSFEFSEHWGHFTQVIWADSYKLGCAEVLYNEGGRSLHTTLVCNYGPGGNMPDSPVYKRGTPCNDCADGTACKDDSTYPSLCASEPDFSTESSEIED